MERQDQCRVYFLYRDSRLVVIAGNREYGKALHDIPEF